MKIKQEELIKKIEDQDYLQDLETVKYAELTKTKLKSLVAKLIQEVIQAAKHDSLIQTQLAVAGQRPVTFALESNIINLPFSNYKKISNFCDTEEDYEVNIYFETISEFVNVSGFRIDILGTMSEITAEPDKYTELLVTAIDEKIKAVRSYEKPEAKKTTSKTAKTTKTTKKTKKTTKK